MRIVKNLDSINECPNCGSSYYLKEIKNEFGRPYIVCVNCHEELYEDEDTQYAITDDVFVIGKRPDDIDDSLMNIEYAVSDLTRYATTKDELEQMERIRDIFDELISVIRRMK